MPHARKGRARAGCLVLCMWLWLCCHRVRLGGRREKHVEKHATLKKQASTFQVDPDPRREETRGASGELEPDSELLVLLEYSLEPLKREATLRRASLWTVDRGRTVLLSLWKSLLGCRSDRAPGPRVPSAGCVRVPAAPPLRVCERILACLCATCPLLM